MESKVEIEVSARHIHLSKTDFEFLFGPNATFSELHELSQRGEFKTDKEVEIIGPDGSLFATFLSPFRELTQVELSLTDCRQIGILAPYEIEISDGCSQISIKGSYGETSRCAAIVAKRHLHANGKEAKSLGFVDGQKVTVEVETKRGKITFFDVEVKIKSSYQLRVHLDTDEANAAGISGQTFGKLIIPKDDK